MINPSSGQMKLKCSYLDIWTRYFWRKAGEAFNLKNTLPTVKHSCGSIMFCGCFAASGSGELVRFHGIMEREDYWEIIRNNVMQSAIKLSLGRR